MKKHLLIALVIVLSAPLPAQETKEQKNRPKIGLVLSGGGAKGFAHIGVIQVLEKAGIKPDFITGTSMGSIIGALYAIGYTPDQIANISDSINWDEAMSNSIALNDVAQEEKAYYKRFITELSIENKKVNLPAGLIEGQNLQDLLTILTRNVQYESDFSKFPIPYACVATNIETGEPVLLNHGSLPLAIRASMAIPSIFTPVEIEGKLLIDGGWVRNLPVQEAIEMGADIIIAVDVGAPLKKKKDLNTLLDILDQTAWMLSTQDTKKQRELADYLVMPDITGIESFQFDRADTIIKRGYDAAMKQFDQFKELAAKIYPGGKFDKEIVVPPFDTVYTFDEIIVSGTRYTSGKFVLGKMGIKTGEKVTLEEVKKQVEELFGSSYYKKVNFSLKHFPDGREVLQVDVVEDAPAKLKVGIYYDNESSVGLNINLTLRNLAFKNSRLILDGYISENPQVELNYLKYIDRKQNLYAFLNGLYARDHNFRSQNLYGEDAIFSYNLFTTDLGMAYNFNRNTTIGLAGSYRYAWAKERINADSVIEQLMQEDIPVRAFFVLNTFDKPFFPTKGWRITTEVSYLTMVHQWFRATPEFKELEDLLKDELDVDPYFIFSAWAEKLFRVSGKVSLYLSAGLYMPSVKAMETGFNSSVSIGGIAPLLTNSSQFWGAEKSSYSSTQFSKVSFGVQWEVLSNLYLRGFVNYFNYNYPMVNINPNLDLRYFDVDGEKYDQNFGGGVQVAYNSAIGPIYLAYHQDLYSGYGRVFVGVGYPFRKTRPYF